jgi:hypothetical protein
VYTPDAFAAWIDGAPGLHLHDYWLARRADGSLAGFVGFWDQNQFKQMRVVDYSRQLRMVKGAFNLATRFSAAPPMPPAGGEVAYRTAVNVCIENGEADVLRALFLRAYNELRRSGYSLLTVGLDVNDPLAAALDGLLAQPTDVEAWVLRSTRGTATAPDFDGRPLHFEIALV